MKYSLLVLSSPCSGHTSRSAALFARAAIGRGHSVERVFFMDDGVFAGASSRVVPQDDPDPMELWVSLAQEHNTDLVPCISSAISRGLLDNTEAERYDKASSTVHPAFAISGLGQLIDAAANSDRLITFGG